MSERHLVPVLERVQEELHSAALLIENIEHTMVPDNQLKTSEKIIALQNVDLAVQKVKSVAGFLHVISQEIPNDLAIDITTALNLINLHEIRERLRGADNEEMENFALKKASGDIDMF